MISVGFMKIYCGTNIFHKPANFVYSLKEILKKAVTTIAMPSLFYAMEVWYPPNISHRKQIEKVNKFAARLITNDFSRDTTYEELLKKLNWRPLYRHMAIRRLLNLRKYLEGKRNIHAEMFMLQLPATNRHSQRIQDSRKQHSLTLQVTKEHRNCLEEKLAAAMSREMWNALEEETVKANFAEFKRLIHTDEVFSKLCDKGAVTVLSDV